MSPDLFRRQLDWLVASGVRIVGIPELMTLPDEAQAAAITFDDGIATILEHALPELRQRDWTSTTFVVTSRVGQDNMWRGKPSSIVPVFPLIGWDVLAELKREGIAVESHTATHPHLHALDEASQHAEFDVASRTMSHHLGVPPDGVAYPYGSCDAGTLDIARRTHRWGVSTEFRAMEEGDDPLGLPRLEIDHLRVRTAFRLWGTRAFTAWALARRVARAVRARVRPEVLNPSRLPRPTG